MVEASGNCPLSRLSGQEGLLHSFGEDCKFAHVISGGCLRRARLVRFGLPRGLPQDSFGTTSWRVMSLVQLVIAPAMTGSTDPPSAANQDRLASGRWGEVDAVGDGRRRRTACSRMGGDRDSNWTMDDDSLSTTALYLRSSPAPEVLESFHADPDPSPAVHPSSVSPPTVTGNEKPHRLAAFRERR